MKTFACLRKKMVEEQLVSRGIGDSLVLNAMLSVEREKFVSEQFRDFAYQDRPLPIEDRQTISQPYMVAFMAEALGLTGGERIMEIGTGSGYAAAVLSKIAGEVYTLERIERLATGAESRLKLSGYSNIEVLCLDGTQGCPEYSPYDAISVAAAGVEVPVPLKRQLKVGGRLVIPIGTPGNQRLLRLIRKSETEYHKESLGSVSFVPLIGKKF